MTRYDTGRRFEYKTRDDLDTNGYVVSRAAGSKGKVDLFAFKPGQFLFVQCKADGRCDPAEWDRLVELASWVGALPILAQNGPRGRGVVYTHLLAPKVPSARVQPCRPFLLDELAVTQ